MDIPPQLLRMAAEATEELQLRTAEAYPMIAAWTLPFLSGWAASCM